VAYPPADPAAARFAAEIRPRLDPVSSDWPISASRLATFAQCGFRYLLQHVIGLDAVLEPEERRRLEPLERGSLFHDVAERFLRERRDRGELPVRDRPETRRRLMEMADEALASLVAGSPPRFTLLWERERARFRDGLARWLERESELADRATPAHFEVAFGLTREVGSNEPHQAEPLVVELGDGRMLRVSGRIDRIDRRPDGALVLRDYKTGRAPRDDGGLFRGGRQLQIPFYVLAAARIFPDQPVVEAFLDFVDGGRQVSFDPERVRGHEFQDLLRSLVDAIAEGAFVQEPTACDWCDFTDVCGPKGLIEARRRFKVSDLRIQRVLRLRDVV
jgi:ATP-dependent helicase/nuclease subunit B